MSTTTTSGWQPRSGPRCSCRLGTERDNCVACEGTGWRIAFERVRSAPLSAADDRRLFIGIYPAGIVYADRSREKAGDYARCAFLPYRTLVLELERDCPRDLRIAIAEHAATLQRRAGERFDVSSTGQYVILGGAAASAADAP